jgi:hypothetical protein
MDLTNLPFPVASQWSAFAMQAPVLTVVELANRWWILLAHRAKA